MSMPPISAQCRILWRQYRLLDTIEWPKLFQVVHIGLGGLSRCVERIVVSSRARSQSDFSGRNGSCVFCHDRHLHVDYFLKVFQLKIDHFILVFFLVLQAKRKF